MGNTPGVFYDLQLMYQKHFADKYILCIGNRSLVDRGVSDAKQKGICNHPRV